MGGTLNWGRGISGGLGRGGVTGDGADVGTNGFGVEGTEGEPAIGGDIGGLGAEKEGLGACVCGTGVGVGAAGLVELLLNSLTKSFISIVLVFWSSAMFIVCSPSAYFCNAPGALSYV